MPEPKFLPTTEKTHTDKVVFVVSAVVAGAFLAWGVFGTASLGSVSTAVLGLTLLLTEDPTVFVGAFEARDLAFPRVGHQRGHDRVGRVVVRLLVDALLDRLGFLLLAARLDRITVELELGLEPAPRQPAD